MGEIVSKVFSSVVVRTIKNVNVENRAHNFLDTMPAKNAPRHPSTVEILKAYARDNPHILELQKKKDEQLLKHLRDVYVVSTDENVDQQVSKRSLPGHSQVSFDVDNLPVPDGRITLLKTLELLAEYQDKFSSGVEFDSLASKFHLSTSDTQKIVQHFSMFQLYAPEPVRPETTGLRSVLLRGFQRKKLE